MGSYLLSHLHALGGGVVAYLVPFLFVLSLVVFFHELGHFLVARLCGVRILVFSIGFGPEIVGFNDRHGTRWKIAAIPLGGYVKFFGDENAGKRARCAAPGEHDRRRTRAKLFLPAGTQARGHSRGRTDGEFHFGYRDFCRDLHDLRQADDERAGGRGAARQCRRRRRIPDRATWSLSIDGKAIDNFEDMQRIVSESAGDTLDIKVDRKGAPLVLTATPTLKEIKDNFGNVHRIGILGISRSTAPEDLKFQPVSPPASGVDGSAGNLVRDRPHAQLTSAASWSGAKRPTSSAARSGSPRFQGQVATIGFVALIHLAAVLSVSIGLLNLFPIPLLDGGHLLFYSIEAMRGRPLSERAQEVGFRIGLAIVVMLMIFATFNDIVHLRTS